MSEQLAFKEFHWLLAIIQSIDVGVVVFDLDYRIDTWNSFMENHSGQSARDVYKKSFFQVFPEINESWFRRKVEQVLTLETPLFTIWEQRPFVVRFRTYQPITGQEDFMYQNTTLLPLVSISGQIQHVCLIVYDVTSIAVSRKHSLLARQELEQLSRTDRLTGLNNRGYWEEELKREFARYRRHGSMLSLLMLDIDHFKTINDTHGHQVGDRVIQALARLISDNIRDIDIAGRYGGEEFVILLPNVESAGASLLAERLRRKVSALEVVHDQLQLGFTISIGVADLFEPCARYDQLIERADHALYESKRGGRNRVTVYSGESS